MSPRRSKRGGRATRCQDCGAHLLWARSKKTGKPVPLDAQVTTGNVVLTRVGGQFVADFLAPAAARPGLHVAHQATCPAGRPATPTTSGDAP